MRTVNLAKIPVSEAPKVIPEFFQLGLIDPSAKITRVEGFCLVPIVSGKEDIFLKNGYGLTEGSAYTMERRPPQERILDKMRGIPDDILCILPMKWECVGDIVILKLDPACEPYKNRIGEVYAEVLEAKTICADLCGISGEFRRPSIEILYGTNTESTRLENGIRYSFDVSKVMFASGNTDERCRMRNLDCKGETVVDMFAGIGYFTLPIAKYSGARRVFACEKNPESYEFLLKNTVINEVEDKVIPILADNKYLQGKDFADRILMGYVQRTSDFLPKALSMIKKGGIIHYHDTFYISEYRERLDSIFKENCGKNGFRIESVREVKSFAPAVSHYVADVRIF